MKKIFLLILSAIWLALPVHAQHFEWAKSYTGLVPECQEIIGSFTDAEGNIYFLGSFTGGAGINGVSFAPPTLTTSRICTVLGKLSPTGELLWHKTLASSYLHCKPKGLAKAGDSTLTLAASFRLPFNNGVTSSSHNFVFYFDTLLTEDDGYLMPTDSIYCYDVTAFVIFDLDGNLVENHFLQMAYEDTSGNVFREQVFLESYERIQTSTFEVERFTVDHAGNIIVGRSAYEEVIALCDTCNPMRHYTVTMEDGGIGALRIVVDGNLRHTWHPTHRSHWQNVLLFKFSPGFDSLLDATYVLDSTDAYAETLDTTIGIYRAINSIETDSAGNIYFDWLNLHYPSIPIANSEAMRLNPAASTCCLKYTPQFQVVNKYEMETEDYYSRYAHITPDGELYLFYTEVWMSCYAPMPPHPAVYRGDTLDLNDLAFWLRLDAADGRLLAYGKVPSIGVSLFNGFNPLYAFGNNRVFAQVKYFLTIEAPGAEIDLRMEEFNQSLGLMQWDTEGHVLSFIDFDAHSPSDGAGQTHVVDSVVYMTGEVYAGATFGTTRVEPSSNGAAYIAKYVDTSLMHPYVYSDPRQPQYIEWEQDLTFPLSDTLIELTATATSGLPVGYSCDDTTVARVSDGVLRLLRVGTATVTATQNGSTYGYYPAAPVTRLLTVHQEGIEGVEPAACSVYPNPTHGKVNIDMDGYHPVEGLVQRDSSDIKVTVYDAGQTIVSYRNPFHQRVNVEYHGNRVITAAYLTEMTGRREEVRLTATGPNRYCLDLSGRPQATYLLTLITADGQSHTVRLFKQSDIFE